jgi:hypothetical protein
MGDDRAGDEAVSWVRRSARHRRHRPNNRGRRTDLGGRQVSLWYDADEYGLVSAAAARAGLTPTSFVAAVALAVARDSMPPVPFPIRDALVELNAARTLVGRFGTNVNQAVAALNATGEAPPTLERAVAMCTRAADRLDQVVARIQRRLP